MSQFLAHFDDVEAPSGADMQYEQTFMDLVVASQPIAESQIGDEIKPAEEPNYAEMRRLAHEVLQKSHDLRAGILMAVAELRLSGFAAASPATEFLLIALRDYWQSCYPQLDADDENDPTERINALRDLADPNGFLGALKKAPMTASRTFGRMTWRDIQVANGEVTPREDERAPDSASVSAAFKDTDDDVLKSYGAAAAQMREHIRGIDQVFDEKTPGKGPDLREVIKLLDGICHYYGVSTAAPVTAEHAAESTPAEAENISPPASNGGAIQSTSDVQNALDRIIAYYRRAEPSSPLPILLERAKRLAGEDFLTIMRDMAPEGVENVNLIGGLSDDDD